MPLTAAARAEINRKNAAKSRGPITEEGKARSRLNAIKHGLRAEVVALPDEDPEVVRIRQMAWQDYYMPQSPAAQHLVNQCVRATLRSDRCDAYHAAALARQVREAEDRWEDERADAVERHRALLRDDPAAAVRLLRRSGHGCRWLIARWEDLGARLERQGFWHPEERAEAIRLLGEHPEPLRTDIAPQLNNAFGYPEPERSRYSFHAFAVHLFSLICQPDRSPKDLDRLMEPGRMPYAVNGGHRLEALPEASACLADLKRVVADELETLRPLEERLRTEIDEPDRAEAALRARMVLDEGQARLFLRYLAESRTAFHRAYKELIPTLKHDDAPEWSNPEALSAMRYRLDRLADTAAAPGDAGACSPPPHEPKPADPATPAPPDGPKPVEPAPAAAISPNEPNRTPGTPQTSADVATVFPACSGVTAQIPGESVAAPGVLADGRGGAGMPSTAA